MDFNAIENLMKQMNQSDLTLLEIQSEGMHILMQKNGAEPIVKVALEAQETMVTLPKEIINEVKSAHKAAHKSEIITEIKPEISNYKEITSPIVGTFYEAIAPDKPILAKVGDKVKKGQPLCIIEAMKLMNEIESEYDGEIIEVLAKNDQMIEYGQPLFKIVPNC